MILPPPPAQKTADYALAGILIVLLLTLAVVLAPLLVLMAAWERLWRERR